MSVGKCRSCLGEVYVLSVGEHWSCMWVSVTVGHVCGKCRSCLWEV